MMSIADDFANINSRMREFQVNRVLVEDGKVGVFLLKTKHPLTMYVREQSKKAWDHMWKQAGYEPPGVLFCDGDVELVPLRDAELRDLGLMRIPADV